MGEKEVKVEEAEVLHANITQIGVMRRSWP
jgi:hypothetical protein